MKKVIALLTLIIMLASVLVPHGTAKAGSSVKPDGTAHPYVALITDGKSTCSGAALTSLVILTSADCFWTDGQDVYVTFASQLTLADKPEPLTGKWYAHPDYCLECGLPPLGQNGPNVAVVVLDQPHPLDRHAILPLDNQMDSLHTGSLLDVVGYLIQSLLVDGKSMQADLYRAYDKSTLLPSLPGVSKDYLRLTPTGGSGCFQAGGGPVLFSGTDFLVGVLSADPRSTCRGSQYAYSLANQSALDWLEMALDHPNELKARH